MRRDNNHPIRIKTEISEMLGIDFPIIGAPMFLVSYPELVLAVSEAGGIGTFPALNFRTNEEFQEALKLIKKRTKKPIGVNIILNKEHNPSWKEQFKICLEQGVELIITSLGSPRSIVKDIHANGARVFCDVTTLRHGRIIEKSKADALIAVSQGAGGHAGQISPFSLIPYLKKEIGLPVVAAGGIVDGIQIAAAFSLGADAVYIGTGLIASIESRASDKFKKSIIESIPEDIHYTDSVSGIPANWIKSSIPSDGVTGLSEVKRWKDIFSAGHGVYNIKEIRKAKDIIQDMLKKYFEVKKSLP